MRSKRFIDKPIFAVFLVLIIIFLFFTATSINLRRDLKDMLVGSSKDIYKKVYYQIFPPMWKSHSKNNITFQYPENLFVIDRGGLSGTVVISQTSAGVPSDITIYESRNLLPQDRSFEKTVEWAKNLVVNMKIENYKNGFRITGLEKTDMQPVVLFSIKPYRSMDIIVLPYRDQAVVIEYTQMGLSRETFEKLLNSVNLKT